MRHLGMLEGPAPDPVPTQVLDKFPLAAKRGTMVFYYPTVEVGERVREGQRIGSITDFEGNLLQAVEAPADRTVSFPGVVPGDQQGGSPVGCGGLR